MPGAQSLKSWKVMQPSARRQNKVTADDFPEAILLDDGGVVALQFEETVPAAPISSIRCATRLPRRHKDQLGKALS